MKIAVIGLGTMGEPMARNLANAGHSLIVHNRTRERELVLASEGATRAASPKEAAASAQVVMVCVSDTPDLEEILFRKGEGVAEGIAPGGLVIDCSTVSPSASRDFANRLREQQVGYVDAPVSGGSEGAIAGTLAIMCGGSEEDMARATPLLQAMGTTITHVGPVGAGQAAKAVNQVVIAGTYQSVAEGMVLAKKLGVDPRRVVDAISGGAAASWVLDKRASNMIDDSYPLGFRLQLHRKDLGIALDAAREAGCALPMASYVAAAEDGLIAQGHADEDMSALARAVRRSSAIEDGAL